MAARYLYLGTDDIIAIVMVITFIIAKILHVDTALDAALAVVVAYYFGSKHRSQNKR